MITWIHSLDRLLRGELTQMSVLSKGGFTVPIHGLTVVLILLGMTYGVCMGIFALLQPAGLQSMQIVASMVKVPMLFLLTLLVTFPSLYVFNALVGSQLRFLTNLRLLVAALAVTIAVLASFGPIVAFFSVSTTSYPFMKLLNVVTFGVAGVLGLMFLLQTLHRLSLTQSGEYPRPYHDLPSIDRGADVDSAPNEALVRPEIESDDSYDSAEIIQERIGEGGPPEPRSSIDAVPGYLLGGHVKTVFRCWAIVFGLVGAQMAWVLRPFIGSADQPFAWFRPRESNFFENVVVTVQRLVFGS
jgi:hypothetical protein